MLLNLKVAASAVSKGANINEVSKAFGIPKWLVVTMCRLTYGKYDNKPQSSASSMAYLAARKEYDEAADEATIVLAVLAGFALLFGLEILSILLLVL